MELLIREFNENCCNSGWPTDHGHWCAKFVLNIHHEIFRWSHRLPFC
jgi:hypothetical protein